MTVAAPACPFPLVFFLAHVGDQSLIRARIDCVTTITHSVASELHASVIDLNGYVCPNGRCLTHIGGTDLRPDGLHYSRASGLTVGNWVLTQLLGPP